MRRHDRGEAVERLKALRATMPQGKFCIAPVMIIGLPFRTLVEAL